MLKKLSLLALFLATFTHGASVTTDANSRPEGASSTGPIDNSDLFSKLLGQLEQGNFASKDPKNRDLDYENFINNQVLNSENYDPNMIKDALGKIDIGNLFKEFDNVIGKKDSDSMDEMMAKISGKSVAQIKEERVKAAEMINKLKESNGDFKFSDIFGLFHEEEL